MRRVTTIIAGLVLLVAAGHPRAQGAFDVVSVKRNTADMMPVRWLFENGRFTGTNVTVQMLISTAYGAPQQPLADFQISGAPDWTRSEHWDIQAVVTTDAATPTSPLAPLLRQLLESRFGLRQHPVTQQLPIYALVLADKKGTLGPRLRRRTAD